MYRIHPTESKIDVGELATASKSPSVWTVWKKSSMAFPGTDGFSVYDSNGRLAFRVDNYSRRHRGFTGELLLMDGNGRALMALRPQVGRSNHVIMILASHMLYSDCRTRQRNGFEVEHTSYTSLLCTVSAEEDLALSCHFKCMGPICEVGIIVD